MSWDRRGETRRKKNDTHGGSVERSLRHVTVRRRASRCSAIVILMIAGLPAIVPRFAARRPLGGPTATGRPGALFCRRASSRLQGAPRSRWSSTHLQEWYSFARRPTCKTPSGRLWDSAWCAELGPVYDARGLGYGATNLTVTIHRGTFADTLLPGGSNRREVAEFCQWRDLWVRRLPFVGQATAPVMPTHMAM
jgi:hypothetical protein